MTKKIEEYEWFCPQPFMNLYKNVFGRVQPCCVTKKEAEWPAISIDEYFKSEKLKNFRKEMLTVSGEEVARTCKVCIEQERHGPESHRQTYLRYIEFVEPELKPQLEEYLL